MPALCILQNELERQMKKLPRQQIAREALSKSFILRVPSMADALHFSDMYAPEHLIINAKVMYWLMRLVKILQCRANGNWLLLKTASWQPVSPGASPYRGWSSQTEA